jgi:tetratricopeptide (TPR) repeat protein
VAKASNGSGRDANQLARVTKRPYPAAAAAAPERVNVGPARQEVYEFEISFEPVEDEVRRIPEALLPTLIEVRRLSERKPAEAVRRLEPLLQQWPGVPQLGNLLNVCYSQLGRTADADRLTEEQFIRFPDYLFAKVNYAWSLLGRGLHDGMLAALGGDFNLRRMYPHRTQFHVGEVAALYGLVGHYLVDVGDLDRAEQTLDLLLDIDPESPITAQLEDRLTLAFMPEAITRMMGRAFARPRPRKPAAKRKKSARAAKPKRAGRATPPGDAKG